MDPITIATIAIGIIGVSLKGAQAAGLIGQSDQWAKYVNAGLYVANEATQIIAQIKAGSTEYDGMTPEQIRVRLAPAEWESLEAQARSELSAS